MATQNNFILDLIAGLKKAQSKKQVQADAKNLGDIKVPLIGTLNKARTRAQLKQDLASMNGTVNLTGKFNKKGVMTSVQQATTQAQAYANKNSIQYNMTLKKDKLINDIKVFGQQNTKLFKDANMSAKYNMLLDNAKLATSAKEIQNLRMQLSAMRSEIKATNLSGLTLGDTFKKTFKRATELFTGTGGVMLLSQQLRKAWTEALNLDSAYTDLIKVQNELTRGDYPEYLERCNKKAQELATTQQALIESVTEFSKSGYNLTKSNALAEQATILSNVGDMNASDSAKAIISGVQAYDVIDGYEDVEKKAEALIDKYNEIGNTASITTAEIAQGVQTVGSVFADANTSVDEFIALLAAGNRQYQDADALALGLRTSALRIRGCTAELELMGEEADTVVTSTAKLEEKIKALTNINGTGGVEILEADGETFRSIYDIYVDIAKVYKDMSDTDQSALLELIAGKHRASAISATLNNMSEAQEIYVRSLESAGSAQKEYDKFMQSSEASLNQFKATMTETYQSVINGDTVSGILNCGNATLQFANSIGLVESTLKGLVAIGIVKAITTLSTAFKASAISASNFGTALNTVKNMSTMAKGTTQYTNALQTLKMVSAGLSDTQLKQVLASKALSDADRIAILRTTGLTKAQAQAKLAQMGLVQSTKAQTTAQNTATASTFSLTAAVKGFGASLKAAFMSNPVGIVIMGLSMAFGAVTSAIDSANQKAEEARQMAKDAASEANTLGDEVAELTAKYIALSEAVKTDASAKEDLMTTQAELLKKLGLEGESIDDLIAKYGSLSNAIRQASLDSLKNSQIDLIAGVDATREELLKVGADGFWGGNNIINATGDDAVKAFKELEKAGVVDSGSFGTGGGSLVLIGDDTTTEGILENYQRLEDALSALRDSNAFTAEELSDNSLYQAIYGRYSEMKDEVEAYKSSIADLNENLAQQTMLAELQGSEIPKTEEDFETFREELVKTAIASKQFIGNEKEITDAINGYLSTVPEFEGFYSIPLENELDKVDELLGQETVSKIEQLAKIEDLSNGLDQLDSIYADILDKEDFDFSSLLNNDDFANAFSQYTDQYENFIDTITKSPTDINACQEAFNELATAYINGSEALNSLTEATRDSAINELQQMGVSNAEEVVDAYLRISNAKRDALAAGVDMENITLAEINSLYNEGIIALTTAQYLAYYQFQKTLSNENGINTQADCENLIALATNAGITGDVINSLNELMALHQEISLAAQYQDKDTVAVLTARADELLASIKSQASTMESAYNPVVKYTGGTNSLAAANKNLKNATDASNDALKAQKEQLEKNKEALEETKSEYEELYDAIQWFYDKQIDKIDDTIEKINKEIDLLEKQQENMDNILAAIESNYDYEISLIQDKIDALQDANDEEQRALELEEAKRKLQEAKSRKTLLVYTKNAGFTYQVDTKSIAEAESELEELQENEVVAELEKQIDALEEAKDKWSQIPDAYNKAMQEIAASNYFGANWKDITLLPSDELLANFEGKYTGIQSSIDSKNDKIDSLEKEKQKLEELKSLWEDAKNSYRNSQYEAQLASFFGSDYEYQLLNNSASWRRKFASEYSSICAEIASVEEQLKSLNEETASSVESGANRISNAANGVRSALENTGNISKYIWTEDDTNALEYARQRLDALNQLIGQGRTELTDARDKVANFVDQYSKLKDSRLVTDELKNSVQELNGVYGQSGDYLEQMASGVANRLADSKNYTSELVQNTQTTADNLAQVNDQINNLKTSEETVEDEADKTVSNVETTISNLLTKLGELQTKLGEISSSRTEIEAIADEELLDTSAVVDGVHTKVGEIQNAITTLMESITPLHGALDTLMEKMTTLDEVTLSNVISAFGGASGGEGGESKESGSNKQSKGKKGSEGESSGGGSGLLGAVKAVDEAIGSVDNEESLLGKLAQVDASTLENIIAQFGLSGENGDSEGANLLNAVNAVSTAIVGGGKDDENSLIASIEQLGSDPTIEHVTTVSDSFQTLHDTINECVKKVEELSKAIESIPSSTATVGVNGGKSSGRAKGGIITKEDAGDLDFVANSLGEDHMVALTEGEAVVPKETVEENPEVVNSLLSGQKLDLKALVNRDIVLQRATPLDNYSMFEKYKDWVIPDSLIMSRLNLPSQDFSKLGVVNNNQQQTVIQINGDLSFPNIKSGNDAELLLNDLSNMANKARQRSARR